jgi:hypothetical protein
MDFVGTERELDYDFRCISVTMPRLLQFRLVDERCEKMVEDGLLQVNFIEIISGEYNIK